MANEKFVGSWKLVSLDARGSDGEIIYPFGQNPVGMIAYDAKGHMSVHVMCLDRPAFASGDQHTGTTEEIKSALEGYIAYYGTYMVNEEAGTVIHRVEASLFPNWIGIEQKRFFKLSGDRLTLSTPPIPYRGSHRTVTLVWERV